MDNLPKCRSRSDSIFGTLYNTAKLEELVDKAKDWAQLHGLCVRMKDRVHESDIVQIASFSLLPSAVPKQLFQQALDLQLDMNTLYRKVEFDRDFMCSALSNVVKTDEFTDRLLDIYKKVYDVNGVVMTQPISLTIQRPDYMFHQPPELLAAGVDGVSLKQVEVNQVSSAAAGLASTVNNLHKHMLGEIGYTKGSIETHLADNPAMKTVAAGLADAWRTYGNPDAYCLFIVENGNRNAFDQRMMEYEFIRQTDLVGRVLRLTLTEVVSKVYLDEEHGFKLKAKDNNREISVVYFRAGYVPQHYPTEAEWEARLMMEKSMAIKCPWVGGQLAGTKKVQQLLGRPEILSRFIDSEDTREKVSCTFMGLYGFDDYQVKQQLGCNGLFKVQEEMEDMMERVREEPEKFVLKPQLEGGGNNVYGRDIIDLLEKLTPEQLEAYILMDRIFPMRHHNYLVRANEKCELSTVVSELGTFGYVLGTREDTMKWNTGGYLMRTKFANVNEGGIMSGNGAVDSPYFIDLC